MKKWIGCFLILSLLLCGCGGKHPEQNRDLLQYPGLRWGMTFEEVQEALGFSDADIVASEPGALNPKQPMSAAYHTYSLVNQEVFGFPAEMVDLCFHEYTGYAPRLAEVVVYFPDGYGGSASIDIDALRKALTEQYGEKSEVVTSVMLNVLNGKLEKVDLPFPGEDPCCWVSKTTARDLMTQEELEKLYAFSCASHAESRLDVILPTFEVFCQSQENNAVMVELRTQEEGDYLDWIREQGGTGLTLSFNAEFVVHTLAVDRYFE